jgi:WD40 repeat protein
VDNVFTRSLDRFLGRGDASIAIPPMDGALKPNGAIDEAEHLLSRNRPDNLIVTSNGILFSSDRELLRAGPDFSVTSIAQCEGEILATASAADGTVAIFDQARGLSLLNAQTCSKTYLDLPRLPRASVTAAAFRDPKRLIVCVGSSKNTAANWQRDLLESEAAGSVWSIDVRSGDMTPLAEKLRYPAGCLVLADGRSALVSESWTNRLLRFDLDGAKKPVPVLTALPGYPSRLAARAAGGAWLCLFAPRNQLVEFVRREPGYRRAMMAEVPKEFWIAPSLASGKSFSEPMQGGALKQMGILKPWAPTRSYGLIVALNDDHTPVESFHSRTGGKRHGLTSVAEWGSRLIVASKGGDELLAIELSERGNGS